MSHTVEKLLCFMHFSVGFWTS